MPGDWERYISLILSVHHVLWIGRHKEATCKAWDMSWGGSFLTHHRDIVETIRKLEDSLPFDSRSKRSRIRRDYKT